jgi:ABC-type multidrug transport system fused ATPase/permease subunit
VVTDAHRQVLVLGAGHVVEFGAPRDLLRQADGAFAQLVAAHRAQMRQQQMTSTH